MYVVILYRYGNDSDGRIICRSKTLTGAREYGYWYLQTHTGCHIDIHDDRTAKKGIFKPTGQKINLTVGDKIAEMHIHRGGASAGTVFYYPDWYSPYYEKEWRRKDKAGIACYHKYKVREDGSLGKGYW